MLWSVQTFRLVPNAADSGLFCSKDQIMLGGLPLLSKTNLGFQVRPLDDLQRIFDAAYGDDTTSSHHYLKGLQSIAQALDTEDVARAAMLCLMLRLPDIDRSGMLRLQKISSGGIEKYSDDQPRDSDGRWTDDNGQSPDKAMSQALSANSSLAGGVRETAFHSTGRRSNQHRTNSNIVPAQALTLPLFPPLTIGGGVSGSSKPKDDEIYPTPTYQTDAGQVSNDNSATRARASTDKDPRTCPDPSFEADSAERKPGQLLYQAQISGLPLGMGVKLNGVKFDGCRESDGTMLEAKTTKPWFVDIPDFVFRKLSEYSDTVSQAFRQISAADGRKIEWHFADPRVAAFWDSEFKRLNYKITVRYTPFIPAVIKIHFGGRTP